ncbi:MAG: chemotaxis protein CheW [Candidatus Wallbacteria bacterium]|nr:chemotaxis protein CheW [Candidatus Wallbacteria bacterium]
MTAPSGKLRIEFRVGRGTPVPSLKGMEVVASLLPMGAVLGCEPDILENSPDSTESFYAVLLMPASEESGPRLEERLRADPELSEVRVLPASSEDDSTRPTRELQVQVERLRALERQASEMVAAFSRMTGILTRLSPAGDSALQAGRKPPPRRGLEEIRAAHQSATALAQQMRDTARSLLLVPARVVLARLNRPVRDLARELGKQIELTVLGDDTELEQSILDELREPLVHLVRNSVGHGIEAPEERIRAGKPPTGSLVVSAYVAGDNFVIEVKDDGRGLDLDRIGRRAMQMGLTTADELRESADETLFKYIYLPGFSTADSVSTLSGRGIGLDVVKARVVKLHGTIETTSQSGLGTTFTLRVPLSTSLIRALVVETADQKIALPSSAIRSVGYAADWTASRARSGRLFSLAAALGWGERPSPLVVEVGVAERRIALGVEACRDHEELAIRPLGRYLGHVPSITGAAILRNGQPVLVLDTAELADQLGI